MYQICFKAFATLHFLNVSKKEQRNLYKVDRISSKIIVSQQVSVGMKAVLIILKSKMFPNQSSQVPTKRKKKKKMKKKKNIFFFYLSYGGAAPAISCGGSYFHIV